MKKYPGEITAQYALCDDNKQPSLCLDASETTSGYGRFANSALCSGKGSTAEYEFKVKMSKRRKGKGKGKGKKIRKILVAKSFATKPLKKGDEIPVDYGADYDFSH